MKKLYGITTAMTTPFREDGKVDIASIEAQTEMLIRKGVNCLYPSGTTGEMLRLSTAERREIMEAVVSTAKGRVPVFIHCGAMREEDVIELARHAAEVGADGIGVVTPQFFGVNDREMEEFYVRVAKSIPNDYPMYLYCIPQCAANDIKASVVQAIAGRAENVVGIKYSFADINRTMDYLKVNDYTFSVMHGCDRTYLAFSALGCDGTVSGISGVFPEPFVEVQKAIEAHDLETARKWQRQCARITDILKGGSNMSYFKEALTIRGMQGGHMRKPQLDIEAGEVAWLQQELERFCADTNIALKA